MDKRYYHEGVLFFPDDDFDVIPHVSLHEVTEKGKKYMLVKYRDTKNAKIKEYVVNRHIVGAGCAQVKNNELKCEHKELYYVMHPLAEWNSYHVLNN